MAAHELKSPLLVVQGFLDVLRRTQADRLDDEGRACVEAGLRGAQRMQQLIENLLAYSTAGRVPGPPDAVDLGQVVDGAIKALGPDIEQSGAVVTRGGLPVVAGDEMQLGQVFRNLLANALRFHGPGVAPVVSVTAEELDGSWRVAVSDNGIGIPVDKRDEVFAMFTRLHDHQMFPGSGIGLAICRRIVEAHGGTIGVEDAPDGPGTSVVVALPR